ncbi:MAG: hypothetical protein V3U28_11410, partial [Candidatus Acidoferrales bacterium]
TGTISTSDEGIRIAADETVISKCIVWTDADVAQTDGIFSNKANADIIVENCIVYGFRRAGIHSQTGNSSLVQNWTIRNCSVDNCGREQNNGGGGISAGGNSVTLDVICPPSRNSYLLKA